MLILNAITGEHFTAKPGIDLVSAAIREQCAVGHSCRQGVCGSCSATLLSGTFSVIGSDKQITVTTEDPPHDILLCQTVARSPLTIAHTPPANHDRNAAQIKSIAIVNDTVARVELQMLTNRRFNFKPGQFIGLRWQSSKIKYFSIASAPNDSNIIELHIRRQFNGEFTEWLFSQARQGDIFGVDGPIGDFSWVTPPERPVILLATGTGFSPIASLVNGHDLQSHPGGVFLYWGGRQLPDLYFNEQPIAWQQSSTTFKYIPVLSSATESEWKGRTGRLHDAALSDHIDLSGYDVYACGSPDMITSARSKLVAEGGLNPERFFADAFNTLPPSPAKPIVSFEVGFTDSHVKGRVTSEVDVVLLQALVNNGLNLDHYCGGGAVCATCRVNILPARGEPTAEFEQDLLDCLSDLRAGDRLACQLVVNQSLAESLVQLPGHPEHISRLEEPDHANNS